MISEDRENAVVGHTPSSTPEDSAQVRKLVYIRYWGSHFKSRRQVDQFRVSFNPLKQLEWRCILVLERLPEESDWLQVMEGDGIELVCIARPKGSFDIHNVRAVRNLCREVQCGIFHCDNIHLSPLMGAAWAGVAVRVWCKRAMNSHYEQCREPGWKEKISLTTRLSLALATRVIAVSGAVARELLELGALKKKVVIINNPRPEIGENRSTRESSRAILGIPLEAMVVVAIGRVEKVKGWDILIDAFLQTSGEKAERHLLLVGATDVRGQEAFKNEVDQRRLTADGGGRIHLTGHVGDVKVMLAAADIFALPSRSEGCCNALLEALEAGLPFIATDVGNARDVWNWTKAGILIPRDDVASFANALEQLSGDRMKRKEFASCARMPAEVLDRASHARAVADCYLSQ